MDTLSYDLASFLPSNRERLTSESSDRSIGTDVSATSSVSHHNDVFLNGTPEQPTMIDVPEHSKVPNTSNLGDSILNSESRRTTIAQHHPRSSFPQLIDNHAIIPGNNSSQTKPTKMRRSRTHRRSQFCFIG